MNTICSAVNRVLDRRERAAEVCVVQVRFGAFQLVKRGEVHPRDSSVHPFYDPR